MRAVVAIGAVAALGLTAFVAYLIMPTSPQYPGEQAIEALQDNCSSEFTRYAPNAPARPTFNRFVISPSPESWADGGRSMVCIATTEQDRSQSIRV
jgi:hypothetical protein